MMLREELLKAWWKLSQIPGIGRVTLGEIRQQLSHPNDLLNCDADQLVAMGLSAEAAQRWQSDSSLLEGFDLVQNWQRFKGYGVLLAGVAPYPETLASLRDAPLILYYHGNIDCLNKPMVAMVGSRKPSDYGARWAQQTAQELATAGVTVVSGLAIGIDGHVHQGAVAGGSTIAVMGSGPDVIYPQRHLGLAQMIMQDGLLLSEFPPGTEPQSRHFPSRNRIISGLSLATVVVEAAVKSGSLITAHQAAEQGREVFALPGMVSNPVSQGCHQLIRDGAYLVQSADDILLELGLKGEKPGHQSSLNFDSHASVEKIAVPTLKPQNLPPLVTYVDFTATSADLLAIRSGMPMDQLLPALMELELEGWITQAPGGYQRLK
jgi:DNA processing protein